MIHEAIIAAGPAPVPDAMVTMAARCWREAKNRDCLAQPALHALLQPAGYDLLAPVFDSLMRLSESRIGRRFGTGSPVAPSVDEDWLCRLLSNPPLLVRTTPSAARDGVERAFVCALHSVPIMLTIQSKRMTGRDMAR